MSSSFLLQLRPDQPPVERAQIFAGNFPARLAFDRRAKLCANALVDAAGFPQVANGRFAARCEAILVVSGKAV